MDGAGVLINAKYEERMRIKHLSMEPSLEGAKVQFEFEAHLIEITLPKFSSSNQAKPGDPYAEAEADVWDKHGQISNIHIYVLSVSVLALQFRLPVVAAKHPHINASLYTTEETRNLDEKSNHLYFLGRRAVDYFLRVVRWKTGLGLIALDAREDRASASGGRLFNLSHGGSFYSPAAGRTIVVPRRHRLTMKKWNDIVVALSAGLHPPIWNEFLMSAERRLDMNDLRAATIDLAIAAESKIRQFPGASRGARKNTISNIFANWTRFGFPATSRFPWFAQVKILFRVRNKLMHSGEDRDLQLVFCREAAAAVENLIVALS